jgi:hypothetical protein
MSFAKWVESGRIKAEATSHQEIRALLDIVARDLEDAKVEAISDDRRFDAAFSAARTAANVALRASGFRISMQLGHHQKTIDSLELTIGADVRLIQKMRVFAKKRNTTSYDSSGNISEADLEEVIRVAVDLQREVFAWLHKNHSALMRGSN